MYTLYSTWIKIILVTFTLYSVTMYTVYWMFIHIPLLFNHNYHNTTRVHHVMGYQTLFTLQIVHCIVLTCTLYSVKLYTV